MDPPLPLPMQPQHLPQHSSQGPPSTTSSQQRPTVSRNARACTVCRAVKMKCVGAEDGQQPCQRCKRSNLQCVFEKHRRGRKPGSKLSDTSKMMRRIDKAPSDNSTTNDSSLQPSPPQQQQHIAYQMQPHPPYDAQPHQPFRQDATAPVAAPAALPGIHHLASTAAHLPPVSSYNTPGRLSPSRHFIRDAEPRPDVRMYDAPSAAHRERNNFFGTVLAPAPSHPSPEQPPEHLLSGPSSSTVDSAGPRSLPPHRASAPSLPRYTAAAFTDPVSAGILIEADAANLFELILHRLNGFLMLFDPSLHTLHYIRERSPFLLTCLLTVACKFWRPEVHRECLDLVNTYVPLAFERGWRSTEVVQAFLFLTFYPEVGHDRTWAFIGYACRMAVDLGMHRMGGGFDALDSGVSAAERRNRERTFLVLFVQERCWASLSGKQSMLPDSDLVRSANSWHIDSARLGGPVVNDVMLCAIVELRRIATETYGFCKSRAPGGRLDVDTDVVLVSCNNKLTDWMELWHATLQRSGGQMFHFSVLCVYRLQARVFVNGLGIESVLASSRDNSQILTRCYTSGISALLIPSRELAPEKQLRYTHHLITAIIAHCAVFLLRALEIAMPSQELADRHEKTMESIAQTADAYEGEEGGNIDAALFLRALLKSDVVGYKTGGGHSSPLAGSLHTPRYRDGNIPGPSLAGGISRTPSPEPVVVRGPPEPLRPVFRQHPGFEFPAGPDIPMHPSELAGDRSAAEYGPHAVKFWKTMFSQLGFGHPQAVPESG